jgi:cell division protein FtsZ
MPVSLNQPEPKQVEHTPRMPGIDELPLSARNEIRAQRSEVGDDHPERRRMTLMQRLASAGLGRRASIWL